MEFKVFDVLPDSPHPPLWIRKALNESGLY
jgi:hypothetical protein